MDSPLGWDAAVWRRLAGEIGRTAVIAANALVVGGSEEQKDDLLGRIAAGEATATVAGRRRAARSRTRTERAH